MGHLLKLSLIEWRMACILHMVNGASHSKMHSIIYLIKECLSRIYLWIILQQVQVTTTISNVVMQIVEGIMNIQVERDNHNRLAEDQVPPVLPHELVKLKGREFICIVVKYLPHFKQFWTDIRVSKLEMEHRELLLLYQHNADLRLKLDKCDHTTSFQSGWAILEGRHALKFTVLRDFCGGIALVFPNTAMVESDFSILG